MKKVNLSIFAVILIFLAAATNVLAQDGQKLYVTKFCSTCHGKAGISVAPNYPNLAGQNELYLFNQVKDILSGNRKTKLTILMTSNPEVQKISDEEIGAITAYLSKLK